MLFTLSMKIGTSLRKLRESKKLSQADIAAIVETSTAAISLWENDKFYPEFKKLVILAEYFNIPVEELITYGRESKNKVSKEELEMLKKYRNAPLNIRESIKLILK